MARVLLVIPPFGGIDRPSLGIHTLQAVARSRGHLVDIYYSNMDFAARLGEVSYMIVTSFGVLKLFGERALGLKRGAIIPPALLEELNEQVEEAAALRGLKAEPVTMELLKAATTAWLNDAAMVVRSSAYDVIGFSTTFEQTNGVDLLAKLCRSLLPSVKLVAGGANCEGRMAEGMRRYIPELDTVFSGESEIAFADYLDDPEHQWSREIVHATPNSDLEALPDLDFEEFFEQHKRALPRSVLRDLGDLRLSYETSRGCWWGQKHHCTFCGLNGNGMGYREKSADRVISELMHLVETTGISKIDMTDNIMPFAYFNTLIPKLANLNLPVEIFYEQKANISLDKVLALKAAGINRIQPGIEAISDPLLKLMRKGTSTKQNIALLRYARSIGMMIDWNLLSGFPNDREEWYAQTLELSRVCLHLPPPTILTKVNFDRFSPYFENPVQFGITNLTPHYNYAGAFPEAEQLEDLAYHFTGDCSRITVDNSAVLRDLRAHIAYWRQIWDDASADKPAPCLEVIEVGPDSYLLIDTRPLPQAVFMRQISTDQARVALLFHSQSSDAVRWGVEQAVCFPSGDGYIPLACASPSVLQRFESLKAPDLADVAV